MPILESLVAGVLLIGVDGQRATFHNRTHQVEARVLVIASAPVEIGVRNECREANDQRTLYSSLSNSAITWGIIIHAEPGGVLNGKVALILCDVRSWMQ